MSEQNKITILKAIANQASVDSPATFSFVALAKATDLSKEKLDELLIELEKDRYITEFVVEGNNIFRITLHQKGFDASQQ